MAFGREEVLAVNEDCGATGGVRTILGAERDRRDFGYETFLSDQSPEDAQNFHGAGHPSKCRSSILERLPLWSAAFFVLDNVAGFDMLEVVSKHRFAQAQHL